MDSRTFDRLVADAARRTSRRSTLRLLAGGLVGGLIALRGSAALAGEGGATIDSDGDGLFDTDENLVYGTNPFNSDTDFDGSGDGEEVFYGTDPLTANGGSAAGQIDSDADGLFDADETGVYGTSPGVYDSDGDGVGDGQEVYNGTDPLTAGGGAPAPAPAPEPAPAPAPEPAPAPAPEPAPAPAVVCPNGGTLCLEVCVDVNSDPFNCGGCGNFCITGCSSGRCAELPDFNF